MNRVVHPPTERCADKPLMTHAAPNAAPQTPALPRKTLTLAQLLGGAQSIDINHNGHVYRLQLTKTGKLILTK